MNKLIFGKNITKNHYQQNKKFSTMKKCQIVIISYTQSYAQRVWNRFIIKITREYQNLYNMQDTLLLLAVAVYFKIDTNEKYYL